MEQKACFYVNHVITANSQNQECTKQMCLNIGQKTIKLEKSLKVRSVIRLSFSVGTFYLWHKCTLKTGQYLINRFYIGIYQATSIKTKQQQMNSGMEVHAFSSICIQCYTAKIQMCQCFLVSFSAVKIFLYGWLKQVLSQLSLTAKAILTPASKRFS